MRIDRVFIDGFKNLKGVEVDFAKDRLTTVIIGQNGTGKSNLIEAITEVFRSVDMNGGKVRYDYEIDYRIDDHTVRLSKRGREPTILVDGSPLSWPAFRRDKRKLFPDLVFGYYSGGSQRLERLFDSHQRRYYNVVRANDSAEDCRRARDDRRLFYCRPIHGMFALLSIFAYSDAQLTDSDARLTDILCDKLGITGFHSALALFREPSFPTEGPASKRADARDLWGATGPAGACARAMRDAAFYPLPLNGNIIDDYREEQKNEPQFACFLRDQSALDQFAQSYSSEQDMFAALETTDVVGFLRDLYIWVFRKNDQSGEVAFSDLSDGERQLLMVLGLIRASRGKRALFLLDEPDTHLNPTWQHTYLDLIREWTGIVADTDKCQIVLTSHNPLTAAALSQREVRIMFTDETGKVTVSPPYVDPKGMGFTAILTEIFGLSTTVDPETQRQLDERNSLTRVGQRTEDQDKHLIALNDYLNRLGFMFEDREPLYQDFLRAMRDVRYADRRPLSPQEIEKQSAAMKELVRSLLAKKELAR